MKTHHVLIIGLLVVAGAYYYMTKVNPLPGGI